MKRLLLLLTTIFLFTFSSRAQYVTIPDPAFRSWLSWQFNTCFNASGMMDTTCPAIVNATSLSLPISMGNVSFSSWDGLQYFKNVQILEFRDVNHNGMLPAALPASVKELTIWITNSNISALPALPAGLIKFRTNGLANLASIPALPSTLQYFSSNPGVFTSLPALPPGLLSLECVGNVHLASLPSLPNSLRYLNFSSDSLLVNAWPVMPASLDTLRCAAMGLTTLPSLPPALKWLDCYNNSLTSLPSLPTTLQLLNCHHNQLTSLPQLDGTSLIQIRAGDNNLTSVPGMPATMQAFDVNSNQITNLPQMPAACLQLECANNLLHDLPPLPAGLVKLDISGNPITTFPTLPVALYWLVCQNIQATSLPGPLPDSLRLFDCSHNLLTGLPNIPALVYTLDCSYNNLLSLPPLPNKLRTLIAKFNDLSCLPVLPSGDSSGTLEIYFDNKINCVANYPANEYVLYVIDSLGNSTYYSSFGAKFPICNVLNNPQHCASFPLMRGYVYCDNNHNHVHDAGEPYRANVRVSLSDGTFTFSNSNGFYELYARTLGNFSVSAFPPANFLLTPNHFDFAIDRYDTLLINDFACQPNGNVDSVHISVTALNAAPVPGFSYPYLISYENDGSTTLSANITLNFDNTRLVFDSASSATVVAGTNSLSIAEPVFVAGSQKSFIGYFRVVQEGAIGDSLRAYAHLTTSAVSAHDSIATDIRGSCDPNDKSATPVLTTIQLANDDYIYYTIRFQNVGNYPAVNVLIADTLTTKLRYSTLQMVGSSHPCVVHVKSYYVSFSFENIMLPDSVSDEIKSHGYITFRIKPKTTLPVNSTVLNKASIYFDFNNPVVTNSAVTTIIDPVVVPLKLVSFTVSRGVGKNANLYWQTNDEINVKDYTIEMSTDGRTFSSIANETAKGFPYNSYTRSVAIPSKPVLYFRLRMNDIDSRYTYSNIAVLKNDKANNAFSFLNNPVKDELSISLQDESLRNTAATIFTAQGIKVKTVLLQHDVENINIKSLPAGTYYLVTEKGSGQFVVLR